MRYKLNQNGFTYLMALTLVMVMGIMLSMIGQSWKTIMQREREKELLFRGSQIKEAIENWYNPKYTLPGVPQRKPPPLMDLKELLQDSSLLTTLRYLPHTYARKLEGDNARCAPDCADVKVYEDPMTGKKWDLIKCGTPPAQALNNQLCKGFASPGGIIGVASPSKEAAIRVSFKDYSSLVGLGDKKRAQSDPDFLDRPLQYRDWQFVADKNNDHSNIYNAYHERW